MAAAWRSNLISVIIPTHNRAGTIDVAIASVMRSPLIGAADQIIVVDDDSEDETEQVVRQFGVTYRRVACRNASASRNAGFALVETPYVTFLDDDDAWLPGNLEQQLSALEARPGAAFAYGVTQCATQDLEPLPWTYPSPPLASGLVPERLHLAYPQLGVVLFRREAIAEVEGFDSRLPYYEDADLMIRIAAKHEIVGVTSVGILHRLRGPSRSRDDRYWTNRDLATWRPKGVGIGWRTSARYFVDRKSWLFERIVEDATACAASRQRRNGMVCLLRAAWISPPHAVRHPRSMVFAFCRCLRPAPHLEDIVGRRRRAGGAAVTGRRRARGLVWPSQPRRRIAGRTGRPSRTVSGPLSNARL
jgi:glycosyltransferase involved in cell wall biosynthesis